MAITAADVIAYARAATDHDSDTQITDPALIILLNPIWQRVRRKLGQRVPTVFSKVTTFTIASGSTQDVTAAPLSLTDFERVRRLRKQVSNTSPASYIPIGTASKIDPEGVPWNQDIVFLERGTVLEFFPAQLIPGATFELVYISKVARLAGGGSPVGATDILDAPDGIEEVLGEALAAKIRPRFDEDPGPHLNAFGTLFDDYVWDLTKRYGVHPEGMPEDGRS